MTELTMLDIEMGFVDSHDEVMDLVGDVTMNALKVAYNNHADDLRRSQRARATAACRWSCPRYTVAEIHELYTKATQHDTTNERT